VSAVNRRGMAAVLKQEHDEFEPAGARSSVEFGSRLQSAGRGGRQEMEGCACAT
jgi:hypothetical protein